MFCNSLSLNAQNPDSHHTITVAYTGPCNSGADNRKRQFNPGTDHCNAHCNEHNYDPLCGSNGQTYDNRCLMELDNCLYTAQNPDSHHTITVAYTGPCNSAADNRKRQFNPGTDHCNAHCNEHNYDPLCGSNGQTYDNRCLMELDNCLYTAQNPDSHHTITVAYNGPCNSGADNRKRQFNPGTDNCNAHCNEHNYDPLCGSNGQTYDNRCLMELDNCLYTAQNPDSHHTITVAYTGPCNRKRQFNPGTDHCNAHCNEHNYDPLCGSNGQTYDNRCLMELDNCLYTAQNPDSHHTITVAYHGPCNSGADNRKRQFNPGTDHCNAHCNEHNYDPLCGSNGQTYDNRCLMELDNCLYTAQNPDSHHTITVAYTGPCNRKRQFNPGTDHCNAHCNEHNYDPLCGSNGQTYDNRCLMELDNCLYTAQNPDSHHTITVAYTGPCNSGADNRKRQFNPGTDHCNAHCNEHNYDPLCGSNGQTYDNRCLMELDNCLYTAQNPDSHHTITVAYNGPCNSAADNRKRQFNPGTDHCNAHCNEHNYDPLCGSNGQTYDNRCLMELDNCLYTAQNPDSHHTITVAHTGPCNRKRQFNPGNEHCNTHCNDHYDPVCGSNGQTYDNRCLLELDDCMFSAQHPESHHTITVAYNGVCNSGAKNSKRQFNPGHEHCNTHCSDHYDPVCGSNDQTYTNRCFLELDACQFSAQHPDSPHTITLAYHGACNSGADNRKRQFNPGTDHCNAHCNEHNYDPLCGSNGQTYDNRCLMELDNCLYTAQNPDSHHTITVAYNGPCNSAADNRKRQFNPGTDHCNAHCNEHNYDPLCGSNGQTYDNRCLMELDNCLYTAQNPDSHHTITVAYTGPCNSGADNRKRQFNPGTDHCNAHCNEHNYDPLCGSNGQTYDNRCLMELDNCLYTAQNPDSHHTITVAHTGPCNRKRQFNPGTDDCNAHCPNDYDPVCGSNHQTYNNRCYLEIDACIFSAQHPDAHHTITVAYNGPCNGAPGGRKRQFDNDCPMFCPEYYSPVCGSNGQIYDNICFLESAACIYSTQHPNSHHTITVADDGFCQHGALIHDSAAIQDGVIHDGIVHDRAI
ncbi:PREDICTED: agrin-like [Branchiostoma belcheri]|uniref:Agrin-like n=1 Tax=Branchiostoma belcheri TaxID=7741 RepID=A0A6P4ZSC9_BRABE|nr:PREDICTED: agrin-like [Branchiostoma belcheri]